MLTHEDQAVIERIIQSRLEETLLSKDFILKFVDKFIRVMDNKPFYDFNIILFKEKPDIDSAFLVKYNCSNDTVDVYRNGEVDEDDLVEIIPTFQENLINAIKKDLGDLEDLEDNYLYWVILSKME
jgi:hypothetical protein